MRPNRLSCGHRARLVAVGPSTVTKLIVPEDSCHLFAWYQYNEELMSSTNSVASRPDPIGLENYNVKYSLNKKARWTIPARFKNDIEEFQDPIHNLRVSASTHCVNGASAKEMEEFDRFYDERFRPALSYHTVSRDGQRVVHNYATMKGRPEHINALIKKDEPPRARSAESSLGSRKRRQEDEPLPEGVIDHERDTPEDSGIADQKLHVQYFATEFVFRRSTFNDKIKKDTDPNVKKKLPISRLKKNRRLLEESKRDKEEEEEEAKEEEEEYECATSDIHFSPSSLAPDLTSFIVRPPAKQCNRFGNRHPTREPFMDERSNRPSVTLISHEVIFGWRDKRWEQDEGMDIVEMPPTTFSCTVARASRGRGAPSRGGRGGSGRRNKGRRGSRRGRGRGGSRGGGASYDSSCFDTWQPDIHHPETRCTKVTALPQLYSRLRLAESRLESLPALPVQPRAWQVHSHDTLSMLGRAFPFCIVAKEMGDGDEIGLFAQENCLTCIADRWGRFRILLEGIVSIPEEGSCSWSCGVCCRDLVQDALIEEERPFGLSCGHMFCTECWLMAIEDGIKKEEMPTTCLESSCEMTLSIVAASSLLDSVSLRRYTENLTEALIKQQQIVQCRSCSRLHKVVSSHPSVRCVCGALMCSRCSSMAHAPISCPAFAAYSIYMIYRGFPLSQELIEVPAMSYHSHCPRCGETGEEVTPRFAYNCWSVDCRCGMKYCRTCSERWTGDHDQRASFRLFRKITPAYAAREDFYSRRKEVADRLLPLSIKARKECYDVFLKPLIRQLEWRVKEKRTLPVNQLGRMTRNRLVHMMEICYYNSVMSKRSKNLAERIRFAMNYFFNTTDKNRSNLICKTERLKTILNDVSDELFGTASHVEIVY